MLNPLNQTSRNTLQEPLLDRSSSNQASTSKSTGQDEGVRLASPSDSPVTSATLSQTRRTIPSVTPNAKHLIYDGIAREIVGVSDIMKQENPTNVQIQSISESAQGILKFWKASNPNNSQPDLNLVAEGNSLSLGKLHGAALKAGLPVITEVSEDAHDRKGKGVAGQGAQPTNDSLIADLKRRGIEVEIVAPDQERNLVEKNAINIYFGDKFHNTSRKVADFERSLFKKIFAVPTTTIDRLDAKDTDNHYAWTMQQSIALANALSKKGEGVETFTVETKLRMLFNHIPELAPILERASMHEALAALFSPLVASPQIDTALNAIDLLDQELRNLLRTQAGDEEIKQTLEQKAQDLHATGNLFGRVSSKIKENPSNSNELLDHTVAKWLAKGKELEFTQPVIYGLVNPSEKSANLSKQTMLDNLVKAMGIDTFAYEPNTPVVIRMLGNSENFEENVVDPFRERLIVNTKVDVVKSGDSAAIKREIDLKQAPLVQTLENIVSGRHDLVHPDLLEIIDKADIFDVSSSRNPNLAEELRQKFHNPDDLSARDLKRTMVARLLLPALSLEGTSVSETAGNLAVPTVAGLVMDIGKNFIPDNLSLLKTAIVQTFFLGVDAADNLAGAWPEVQSLLETMGIKNVDYESVFGEKAPEGAAAKAKEIVKLALGLRSAEGEAGPAVATGLRSAVIGTVIGNALTAGYTVAIGALDLNPALRAVVGIPAIVGTSLGIAINFAVNHADLSLAYKQQIDDGTLGVPDTVNQNNPAELNAYCSHLAKKQLMTLSGTGPAAKAFTFAPLAALSNLLGYVVPMKVVEAIITPLMPGMENLVRLGAMSMHNGAMNQALDKLDARVFDSAAAGKSPTVSGEEFEELMYGRMDNLTADFTLMAGGLLAGLLGRNGYHDLQIVPKTDGDTSPQHPLPDLLRMEEGKLDEITFHAQQAARNLQDMDARRTA